MDAQSVLRPPRVQRGSCASRWIRLHAAWRARRECGEGRLISLFPRLLHALPTRGAHRAESHAEHRAHRIPHRIESVSGGASGFGGSLASMPNPQPVSQRIDVLDFLRGTALFGILLMNITGFGL